MAQTNYDKPALKQALKEALAETLREQRDLLHEVFTEVLEDFALAEAIREGQKTKRASRKEVFAILQGKS
jgi:DNA gyrase/topoisomerase IV subunit B